METYRTSRISDTTELYGRNGHAPSSLRIQKETSISWKLGVKGIGAVRVDTDGPMGLYVTVREGYETGGDITRWVERQAMVSLDETESRALYAMLHARYGPKDGAA